MPDTNPVQLEDAAAIYQCKRCQDIKRLIAKSGESEEMRRGMVQRLNKLHEELHKE